MGSEEGGMWVQKGGGVCGFGDHNKNFKRKRLTRRLRPRNLYQPNSLFSELYAYSSTRTLPLVFIFSLVFFNRSDKIVTTLKTCLWFPESHTHVKLDVYPVLSLA